MPRTIKNNSGGRVKINDSVNQVVEVPIYKETPLPISGAAGSGRYFKVQTNNLDRWTFGANQTAEAGSNAGSDFDVIAYADDGVTAVGKVCRFTRSNRTVSFDVGPTAPTAPVGTSSMQLATTQYVMNKKAAALTAAQPGTTAPPTYDQAFVQSLRDRLEDLIIKMKAAGELSV